MEENLNENPYPEKEFERHIELADGTVLYARGALDSVNDYLWIWMDQDISLIRATSIFSNPRKTASITVYISEIETKIFEGYTKINYIAEVNGKINIRLEKGE